MEGSKRSGRILHLVSPLPTISSLSACLVSCLSVCLPALFSLSCPLFSLYPSTIVGFYSSCLLFPFFFFVSSLLHKIGSNIE